MFFRRQKPHVDTFSELIDRLQPYNILATKDGSRIIAARNGIGATITDVPGAHPQVSKAGLIVGAETGVLVNAGYQQFWQTPTRKRVPARADQLKELHAFEEDLKEALGLESLYNTSLGTISSLHLYDRVEDRDDSIHHARPWEAKR